MAKGEKAKTEEIKESKGEKWMRLMSERLPEFDRVMDKLIRLCNKQNYDYTDENAKAVEEVVASRVRELSEALTSGKSTSTRKYDLGEAAK